MSEETCDGFRLKSAEHINVIVGPTARPVLIFCLPPFRCPPAPKFPKRFSREKRKRLRAVWVLQRRNEYIWRKYHRPITVEKTDEKRS